MIKEEFWTFEGKRVLLLQGPIGPFFRRLATDLRRAGVTVFKINFNGGDWLFYPRGTAFRGRANKWSAYFKTYLIRHRIDIVLLFGDCRPLHKVAHGICRRQGIEVGVFEEGYVRPDFITFERFGVNGHSQLPRSPKVYRRGEPTPIPLPMGVGNAFWYAMTWAMLYNTASSLLKFVFPHYRHHRTLTIGEGIGWLRSFWRKLYYSWKERGIEEELTTRYSSQFFLVPLQVYNDAQIYQHSDFSSVQDFIFEVLDSFAAHAPFATKLVIKHHPLDRGNADYTELIETAVEERRLNGRVFYIHDQHLPSLLRHARGVVVINSTVGLSALYHGVPLKTCGKAIYNIEGLVFRGSLEEFWKDPQPGDGQLYRRFLSFLIRHTQINGSFYRRLPIADSHAGVLWSEGRPEAARN